METLGTKLKNIIVAKNVKVREDVAIKEQNARDKTAKERASAQALVDRIKNNLISAVEMGKVPSFSIRNYSQQMVIKAFTNNPTAAKNYDVWDDMVKFFQDNECEVVVEEQHDGMTESWLVVALKPINE